MFEVLNVLPRPRNPTEDEEAKSTPICPTNGVSTSARFIRLLGKHETATG